MVKRGRGERERGDLLTTPNGTREGRRGCSFHPSLDSRHNANTLASIKVRNVAHKNGRAKEGLLAGWVLRLASRLAREYINTSRRVSGKAQGRAPPGLIKCK